MRSSPDALASSRAHRLEHSLDEPVVAEAIQTILRREGVPKPYELLKALTRGNAGIDETAIRQFIAGLEVSDAVPGRPDSEDVVERECGQHGEPTGGTAADHETFGVDVASFGEVAGSSDTVLHVGDTPGAVQRLAVRTAVPGGAAVVDVDDSDSPAGPIENAELELAAGLGGRAAVGENQQRRRRPLHADMIRIGTSRPSVLALSRVLGARVFETRHDFGASLETDEFDSLLESGGAPSSFALA